jgi:hypothetical protein
MMDRRVEEAAYRGEEGAQHCAMRDALRRGDTAAVETLVYAVSPNARSMVVLEEMGFDVTEEGALVRALWAQFDPLEVEWWQALGVNDSVTVMAFEGQGIGVPYMMEMYHHVMEDAYGNAWDNESDCRYEGVYDYLVYCEDKGEVPEWAEEIEVVREDREVHGIGAWYDAAAEWKRDALLGYVECQLDMAAEGLIDGIFDHYRWWWYEDWSKRAKAVHKRVSEEWLWALLAVLFPEEMCHVSVPAKDVGPSEAWWRGEA